MYIGLHVKGPLFLSDFNELWIFWTDFRKILKYQISWKSVQWETSCSVRMEGRTAETTKLVVAFRNLRKRLRLVAEVRDDIKKIYLQTRNSCLTED